MIRGMPYVLASEGINRYQLQMVQASLKAPVNPLAAHSFYNLYHKQREWSMDTATALSRLFEELNQLKQAVKGFTPDSSEALPDSNRAKSGAFSISGRKTEVTFAKTTDGPVTGTGGVDKEAAVVGVKTLIDHYNRFLRFLDEQAGRLASGLRQMWTQWAAQHVSRWEAVGIRQTAGGRLTLDERALNEAIDQDFPLVEQALAGPDGLAARLGEAAKSLQQSPPGSFLWSVLPAANPYTAYLLPSLFYRQATACGLFFNQTF